LLTVLLRLPQEFAISLRHIQLPVQELEDPHFRYLADDSADFLDNNVKTTADDRYNSLCNILRGYEEFILNPAGIIISSNLEAVNVTGYEEWEVIGKHISLLYSVEDAAAAVPDEDLKNTLEVGKLFYTGWRVKKKGISFRAKIRITAIRDANQNHTGFRMVIKDTTHNELYNYRVKRVRDEYLSLFNNSFIGILKFRLNDSKILVLNEKARELLGMKEHDEIFFSEIFSDQENFVRFLGLLADDSAKNIETQVEYKGLWLSVSCRSFAKQGFAEGIITDITEKKKQIAELQRLNQEIDKFIYHSSHDMRSPLTTILGLTHLIALENPSDSIQEYNGMVRTQVHHLDNLLKSLVNITFNKSEPVHEVIDFEKELEVILREYRHQYHSIRVETIVNGSHTFMSDPARIHIILKNLISNAFRFHNPHAESPFVRITISPMAAETMIEVDDNGVGIDARYLEDIFTMFYKAERGSTGLGLYIVKSMVDKLGGKVLVKSDRWIGSGFKVQLPNIRCLTTV
jgi:PAS domain S-box-containing protein